MQHREVLRIPVYAESERVSVQRMEVLCIQAYVDNERGITYSRLRR